MKRRGFLKRIAASIGVGFSPTVLSVESNNKESLNIPQDKVHENFIPFMITVVGVGKRARQVLNNINYMGTEGVNYIFTDVNYCQDHMEITWIDGPPNDPSSREDVIHYKMDVALQELIDDIGSSAGNIRRFQNNQFVMLVADMSDDAAKLMIPGIAKVIKDEEVCMSVSYTLISGTKAPYFPDNYYNREYMPSYIFDDISDIDNIFMDSGISGQKNNIISNRWLLTSESRYASSLHQIKSILDMVHGLNQVKYFTKYVSGILDLEEFLFQGSKASLVDVTEININRENNSSLISEYILSKRKVINHRLVHNPLYRRTCDKRVLVNIVTGYPCKSGSKKISNIIKRIHEGFDDDVLFKSIHTVNDTLEDDEINVVLLAT